MTMKLHEISTTDWYVCVINDIVTSYQNGITAQTAMLGNKGYVKRNDHDGRYYQLLALDIRGKLRGWYVKEDVDIEVERRAHPDRVPYIDFDWSGYWHSKASK